MYFLNSTKIVIVNIYILYLPNYIYLSNIIIYLLNDINAN